MNSYESLLDECSRHGIKIIEKRFDSGAKGLWKNNKIGISADIPTYSEKACVLSEEYAHFLTSSGDITDLTDIRNKKQELIARNHAYENLCSIEKLIYAFENGASNEYEIVDFLQITDRFLRDALAYHKKKHGLSFSYNNYTIIFEPNIQIINNSAMI